MEPIVGRALDLATFGTSEPGTRLLFDLVDRQARVEGTRAEPSQ